jgi:hypothetical protein
MALNKISAFQTQIQPNTTKQIPIIRSVPAASTEVIKIGSLGTVATDIAVRPVGISDKYFAAKLLNYVESVEIFGEFKTAFYSELATNFKIGDRVFILNGFYDSVDFIEKDKYTQFTDGYRVLGIDGCRIILDIDYTGKLPYTDFNYEDLLFVHNITTQDQFDLINSSKIGLSQSDYNGVYSMFEFHTPGNGRGGASLYGRNIAFISQTFSNSTDPLNSSVYTNFSDPGFYCKQGQEWISVNNIWDQGGFVDRNLSTNPFGVFEANRALILGEDFTFGGKTYRERQVYKYDLKKYNKVINKFGDWVLDKEYKQPIISKLNFRYGKFVGTHNDGIFGSYDRVAKWGNSTWNSGIFVNGNWSSGSMNTKSKTERSYSAKLQTTKSNTKIVLQNVDLTNNRGFGYNYVIDSTILKSKISKGNFENSNLGLTSSENAIEAYLSKKNIYSVSIDSGNLNFCNVYNSSISNSSLSENIIEDSTLSNAKLLNNQLIDCVVNQSQYSSNSGIKIIAADLWSYYYGDNDLGYTDPSQFDNVIGTLKLYISDKDFLKLEKGDSFFIESINKDLFLTNLNNDQKIHLPIENRFIIDFFDHYELFDRPGKKIKVAVSLKPKTSNYLKYYVGSQLTVVNVNYYEPNTESFYWSKIDDIQWTGDWLPEGRDYQIDDFVKWSDGTTERFYYWTGLTESNNIPVSPKQGEDYSWEPLNEVLYWDRFALFEDGKYVLATTVENGTYSLFRCEADNYIFGDIIEASIATLDDTTIGYKKTNVTETNDARFCSIDIESEAFGWYYDKFKQQRHYTLFNTLNESGLSKIPINFISSAFVNSYIKISDFRSGLFLNSTWQSGSNIGYYSNIITRNSNLISLSGNSNILQVVINNNPFKRGRVIKGFDIQQGDSVWLSGVVRTVSTGDEISLTGRYLVLNGPNRTNTNANTLNFSIQPIGFTLSSVRGLVSYSVKGAEGNTYLSISKFSIENSIINYGLFKRTNFNNVLITNDKFDNKDTSFNPKNTSLLRLINIIFRDNNITVNDGVLYRSHFVNGEFNLGIVHNSYWNGNTFSNGIFSDGAWISGRFVSGKFIDSNQTVRDVDYHHNQLFYKNWQSGTFETGDFVNSVWLDGTFNNGRFYGSHFYGGVWNNGILGSKNLKMMSTSFGYYKKLVNIGTTVSVWNYGVVENAILGGFGVVYWYDGKCNAGEFTSFGTTSENESIWYNGEFNGSKFTNLARWKNGVFNSGKFWSYYGWENVGPVISSENPSDYGWETGRFNSGQFGYRGLTSNSTWYGGQFLGGEFMGRFWKSGNFISGNFYGSGLTQSIDASSSNVSEFNFADSFTSSYYGLWASGLVIDNTKSLLSATIDNCQTNRIRAVNSKYNTNTKTNFNNILWLSGTFSHDNASMNNSLWLSGTFLKGEFNGGVFNPYVDRDFTGSASNSKYGENAIWRNGIFVTGSMFSCEWYNGTFKNGYMAGVIWANGTFEYGKADNVYWLDGTWKNGNWNGTPYKYDIVTYTQSDENGNVVDVNTVNNGREKDIMLKVASYISPAQSLYSPLHIMNIFSASSIINVLNINNESRFASFNPTNSATSSWTYSVETYVGVGVDEFGELYDGDLTKSGWDWARTFTMVVGTTSATLEVPIVPVLQLTDRVRTSNTTPTPSTSVGQRSAFTDTDLETPTTPIDSPPTGDIRSIVIAPEIPTQKVSAVKPITFKSSFDGHMVTIGGTNSFTDPLNWSGYNVYSTGGDIPPSSKIYAKFRGVGNSDIFSEYPSTYSIEIFVAVELVPSVEVEIFVGGLSSSIFELETDAYRYTERVRSELGNIKQEFYDYYARVYKINLLYNTSAELISRQDGMKLAIRKNSNGILRILNLNITRRDVEYHPNYHNVLYQTAIDLQNGLISFPATSSVSLQTVSSGGYEIGINFGNGIFKRGIWENGVWNNGYRSSDWFTSKDLIRASDIISSKTYKGRGINTWRITVKCLDELIDGTGTVLLDPNKKISVGNLVNINVNGKRSFIRDPLRITNMDVINNEITFEFVSSFEVRNIEKDSANHLIYISQNIWQNGVFLNGYFKGIWSNGVFKGYPKTTEMVDSHWVTGYFEGGHFKSRALNQNRTSRLPPYNTGLIQNVTFKDRNIVSAPNSSFESWLDLNYFTTSNVNINNYARFLGVSGKTQRVVESYDFNLSGAPTLDVLSSDTFLRNSKNSFQRRYSLGTKYSISNNLLKNIGEFRETHSDAINFALPKLSEADRVNKAIPRKVMFDQGWTYSYFSSAEWFASYFFPILFNTEPIPYGNSIQYTVTSNTNVSNTGKLNFNLRGFGNVTNMETGQVIADSSNDGNDIVFFNLSNTSIQTQANRYYTVEVQMNSFPNVTQSLFYLSDTSQVASQSLYFHNPQVNKSGVFTEYFYNLKGLDFIMAYAGRPAATFSIEKISMNEVDSIPFFKYYNTDSQIDFSIKNPYAGLAPIIDYTNKNFDFIGNVELGIDYRVIVKQNASVTRVGLASVSKNYLPKRDPNLPDESE